MTLWPGGAKCALTLTFDFDAETNWLSRDPANAKRPGTLSQGTYGARVGILNVLSLLREQSLKATFFVPGWVVDNRTQRVEAIVRDGHEIGHHGYWHRWVDPDYPEQELEEMEAGLNALRTQFGIVPAGYRSPAGETSSNLIRILAEKGFLYDSSLMDSVDPYYHCLENGSQGPVELPWHWSLDDAPFMLFAIMSPRPIFTNEHVLSIWKAEFEAIRETGGLINLVMHPQAIGRPSRMTMLRQFIDFTRSFGDVWYATCSEVADHWSRNNRFDPADCAINPFIKV